MTMRVFDHVRAAGSKMALHAEDGGRLVCALGVNATLGCMECAINSILK